jgi:transcriptional regulator with XRE-family HTH domain
MKKVRKKSKEQRLGPLVAALLKQKPLTQAEVAEKAGMSAPQICNFLNGKTDIHASRFVEILEILGIDLMKLVRQESGLGAAEFKNVPQQLSLLPPLEQATVTEFLQAYKSRLTKDALSA